MCDETGTDWGILPALQRGMVSGLPSAGRRWGCMVIVRAPFEGQCFSGGGRSAGLTADNRKADLSPAQRKKWGLEGGMRGFLQRCRSGCARVSMCTCADDGAPRRDLDDRVDRSIVKQKTGKFGMLASGGRRGEEGRAQLIAPGE